MFRFLWCLLCFLVLALVGAALDVGGVFAAENATVVADDSTCSWYCQLWTNRGEVCQWLLAGFGLASLVVCGTRTPPPTTTWGKIYPWIERLALVFGRAKQSAPPPTFRNLTR